MLQPATRSLLADLRIVFVVMMFLLAEREELGVRPGERHERPVICR
jgi:hypothetical protein